MKSSNKSTLEGLFRRHYPRMMGLATAMLGDTGEAEDVVQDVFVMLMERDLRPAEAKMEAYLLSSVRNGCLNAIKRKSVREQAAALLPLDGDDGTDADGLSLAARLEAIHDFVETRVGEPHRSIFRLRFDHDLTLREIAARLGLNANTCYKYLQQTLAQVRRFCEL